MMRFLFIIYLSLSPQQLRRELLLLLLFSFNRAGIGAGLSGLPKITHPEVNLDPVD